MGHAVDSAFGGKIAGSDYAATNAGWQKHDKATIASIMVAAAQGDISKWADAGEKTAIVAALQTICDNESPTGINAAIDDRNENITALRQHMRLRQLHLGQSVLLERRRALDRRLAIETHDVVQRD